MQSLPCTDMMRVTLKHGRSTPERRARSVCFGIEQMVVLPAGLKMHRSTEHQASLLTVSSAEAIVFGLPLLVLFLFLAWPGLPSCPLQHPESNLLLDFHIIVFHCYIFS